MVKNRLNVFKADDLRLHHSQCVLKLNNTLCTRVHLSILKGETLPSPEPKGSNSGHVDFPGLTPSACHVECLRRL